MYLNYLRHAIQKDRHIIVVAACLLLIAGLLFTKFYVSDYCIGAWTNVIDPVITLLTVSVALLVYFSNAKRDWEDGLEKRLTVHFVYKDKYMMSCIQAFLTSEADIRQWGQQIGRQMNNNVNLDFYPFMSLSSMVDQHLRYKDYILTVYLVSDKALQEDIKINYKVWVDNNDETPENVTLYAGSHPGQPFSVREAIDRHNAMAGNEPVEMLSDGRIQKRVKPEKQ